MKNSSHICLPNVHRGCRDWQIWQFISTFIAPMRHLIFFLLLIPIGVSAQQKTYDTLPNLPDHYNKRYEQFRKEPIRKGRIMMVGNSITEGGDWKRLLKDSTVINRGISGDVTFGVMNRLQDITDRQPSKLFILIGINDLSRNTPDEVILENVFMIINLVKNRCRHTEIYLQTLLPTNESVIGFPKNFIGKAEHIAMINKQFKKYAPKLKYTLVDLHTLFADKEGKLKAELTGDGLHLNAKGYQTWVDYLRQEKYID